jgi:hypothetical protein
MSLAKTLAAQIYRDPKIPTCEHKAIFDEK